MKQSEVYKIIDEFAPFKYSDEFVNKYDAYDNSGIIIPTDKDVNSIVFAIDLTDGCIDYAMKNGCQLIVTHHPSIYKPVKRVDGNLLKAVKNGLGIISAHLNLDSAKHGIDYYLAYAFGGINVKTLYEIFDGGYGRVYDVTPDTLGSIKEKSKLIFNSDRVICYGDVNKTVKRIASFCGAGLSQKEIATVSDVDLFVSSDVPHHVILDCLESGKSLLVLTHYACEVYGLKRCVDEMSSKFDNCKIYFYRDDRLL